MSVMGFLNRQNYYSFLKIIKISNEICPSITNSMSGTITAILSIVVCFYFIVRDNSFIIYIYIYMYVSVCQWGRCAETQQQ